MPVYFSKKYTSANNIADGATSNENFVSSDEQDANGPFDEITIVNDDAVALFLNLDGNTANRITILPNSREAGHGLNFRTFSLTANGGIHTAGKVHILVENTKFARRS